MSWRLVGICFALEGGSAIAALCDVRSMIPHAWKRAVHSVRWHLRRVGRIVGLLR